jgi:hypothetical protein
MAQGGLGQVQAGGRLGHAAGVGNSGKQAQVAHVSSSTSGSSVHL